MNAAIEIARVNQTPFGAALAMGDELFAVEANQTGELNDPTAHAEMMAIRRLGSIIKKRDLSGFTLYTTCEPCPMCMSAVIWAKIDAVFYGCSIPEISDRMFQIPIYSKEIAERSDSDIQISGGVRLDDCLKLLKKYS